MVIRIYYTRFHNYFFYFDRYWSTAHREQICYAEADLSCTSPLLLLLYTPYYRVVPTAAGLDMTQSICDLLSRAGHAYSGSSAFAALLAAETPPHQTEWACRHRITNPGSHRLLNGNLSNSLNNNNRHSRQHLDDAPPYLSNRLAT
ncbi:hypothetical protein TsFJ059_005042 [Trichoderma semiorbis]|uniref:Uncharacterized protein n=1 Tax=Trichoderma semiorbis TaxID=1491008 RepID=A0A9P8KVV9_9HYPO|nr:hypothetical protein TsFJ059_005042 [Trichoderma semiorbis]